MRPFFTCIRRLTTSVVTLGCRAAHYNYEEHIAHVIWAAHILPYLSGERSQTGLLPELDTDEDFDADEPDVETQNDII
jgi:hypothetical protein